MSAIESKKKLAQSIAFILQKEAWCVLHGDPNNISSDFDIYGDRKARDRLIFAFANQQLDLVQYIKYKEYSEAFILVDETKQYFQLDVTQDFRFKGRVLYTSEELREAIVPLRDFPRLWPYREFGYYFSKKIAKRELTDDQARVLFELYEQDKTNAIRELSKFLPEKMINEVIRCLDNKDISRMVDRLPVWYRTMMRRLFFKHPLRTMRYWIGDMFRLGNRVLNPVGISVAFFGVDGSGKTTLLTTLSPKIAPLFTGGIFAVHLRYQLRHKIFRKDADEFVVSHPHARESRGHFTSILKILFWVFEYYLTYIVCFYRVTKKSGVIFDRYYHDLLVDPRRYRYGGPMRLARWLAKFIPRPDLFIFLDLPAEVAHARKPEVPLEEARTLRQRYLELARSLPNAHVLDATRPPEEVADAAEEVILSSLRLRTRKRLGVD